MKRYVLLLLFCLVILGGLGILYVRTESSIFKEHQQIFKDMGIIFEWEPVLDREVLKLANFSAEDFDQVVTAAQELERFCAPEVLESSHFKGMGEDFNGGAAQYCRALTTKLENVEHFKTKNAVMRNSFYSLKAYLSQHLENQKGQTDNLADQIAEAALDFWFLPSSGSGARLSKLLQKCKRLNLTYDSQAGRLARHAELVFETKPTIRILVDSILNAETVAAKEAVKNAYFAEYARQQERVSSSRRLLLSSCVILVILLIFNVTRVWKFASQLSEANMSLEKRVEDRTQELSESQKTILSQQATLVIAAKHSALGEMAGQIAHEINTPLGAIILTAQSIKRKVQSQPTVESSDVSSKLDLILQISSKMSRIINSMRRLAGHGGHTQMVDAELSEILDDVTLLSEGRMMKAGIDFKISPFQADLRLHCRPIEIGQVLINLLNNAHDAIRERPEKWIRLDIEVANGLCAFRIADSGEGISDDNKEKLFLPNFTTKSLDQGTGFGLSICKKIIAQHGGRIFADFEKPNTTFVVEIPLEQAQPLAIAVGG